MDRLTRLFLVSSSLWAVACGPSLDALNVRAAAGAVQADAPLHARHEVTIDAPRAKVWALLADGPGWPRWHPAVRSASAPAPFVAGTDFTWNNEGTAIHSRLALVKPPEVLAWTGSVATAKAAHVWRLSEVPPGKTRVEVEETLDGFLLSWFYSQKDLDQAVTVWLADLKRAAEMPPGGG